MTAYTYLTLSKRLPCSWLSITRSRLQWIKSCSWRMTHMTTCYKNIYFILFQHLVSLLLSVSSSGYRVSDTRCPRCYRMRKICDSVCFCSSFRSILTCLQAWISQARYLLRNALLVQRVIIYQISSGFGFRFIIIILVFSTFGFTNILFITTFYYNIKTHDYLHKLIFTLYNNQVYNFYNA
jgi:hypothetical protein